MIFPAEFGELMIEREYTCEKNGVKTPLIVQIDKPRRVEADGPYFCCWRTVPALFMWYKISLAAGVDALQSLNLALDGIRITWRLNRKSLGH